MLQYFFSKKHSINKELLNSLSIEHFCKISQNDFPMSRVLHEHKNMCELILIYEGKGTYIINETSYSVNSGDLILCNSNVLHEELINKKPSMSSFCIGISNLKLPNTPKNHIIPSTSLPIINTGVHFNSLFSLFELIYNSIKSNKEYNYEFIIYLTQAIISKSLQLVPSTSETPKLPKDSLALKIKEYIDQYYHEDITLDTISKAVNANRFYLSHIFKNFTGFSPRQYIIRRRIGEAQNLLINTTMNITKIATSVGYNNSNYFQNVFKESVGYTPCEYRKRWRE